MQQSHLCTRVTIHQCADPSVLLVSQSLFELQPTVADMPGVVCASSYCAATHEKQYKEGLGGVLADRQSGAAAPFVAAGAALLAVAGVIIASVM